MDTAKARAAQNFKDLLVWQRGMQLAKDIYEMTRKFPSEERLGLVAQMRRCAVSIPSNLAEGQVQTYDWGIYSVHFPFRRFAR